MKKFFLEEKAQLSFEGITSGIMLIIMYVIEAAYVFSPIYNLLEASLANVAGGWGLIAATILLLGVYVVTPLLILNSIIALAKPRVEYVNP